MFEYIYNQFGSKKGLLTSLKFQFCYYAGRYTEFMQPNFSKIKRFVFVCKGNICRSALAESVMKKAGRDAISFGLDTRGGDKADPRMIAFGKECGFDLTAHITKPVVKYVPLVHDLLIGMEPSHLKQLHALFPDHQVTTLGLWLPKKKIYLHDPFSANMVYFNRCAKDIVTATEYLYRNLHQTQL